MTSTRSNQGSGPAMDSHNHFDSHKNVSDFQNAKTIVLSQENEPVLDNAINSGSIIENVYLDPNGKPDYTNTSL